MSMENPSARRAVTTKWECRSGDASTATELSRQLGIGPFLSQVLVNRDVNNCDAAEAYLDPRLQSLPDPDALAGMNDAVLRLESAVLKKETVGVFGDYDVDGVTSTAVLSEFLRACGLEVVTTIPNRLIEGYGLSEAGVVRLADAGAQLIVTVDCGVTAHDEISFAKSQGIDVIVIDHHTVPVTLPEAVAVINPHRDDCTRKAEHLCAAAVTFNLCAAFRRHLRNKNYFSDLPEPDLRPLLDLVALGTVADVVPLIEDNRVFVRHGLRMISRQQRPGFTALLEVAEIVPQRVSSGHLAFQLGPRVNAAGRLSDAGLAVTLFQTTNLKEARSLARRLDQENQARRALEKQITRRGGCPNRGAYGLRAPTHFGGGGVALAPRRCGNCRVEVGGTIWPAGPSHR